MPVPGTVPARLPRRALAHGLDATAALVLGGGFVLAATVAEQGTRPASLVVGLVLLTLLGAVQWWVLARHAWTLGRRAVGLRVVRDGDGRPPGGARAFVRLALPLAAWVVPVVGPAVLHLSAVRHPRLRGWHDRAAGVTVIDVVAGADPAAVAASFSARRLDEVLARHDARRGGDGRSAGPRSASSERPAAAPPAVPGGPDGGLVDAVPWAPTSAGTAPAPPPGHSVPHPPGPPPEETTGRRPPRPSSPDVTAPQEVSVLATDERGRPVTRVVPPAPVQVTSLGADDREDVEATRLRPARGRVPELRGAGVTVELTDGRRFTLDGPTLVGRNPSPRPGEGDVTLLAVADPGRSVSKTHLLLDVDRTGLWVKDRDSTNGTVVTLADGQQILCGSERSVRLPTGATVAFGDYGLVVLPADD